MTIFPHVSVSFVIITLYFVNFPLGDCFSYPHDMYSFLYGNRSKAITSMLRVWRKYDFTLSLSLTPTQQSFIQVKRTSTIQNKTQDLEVNK